MPRKVSKRNIPKEQSTIPQTGKYYKFCPCCHRNYWSDARGHKYCSPECQKKDYARKKAQKEEYKGIAPVERLRVRYHALHVETVKMMCELGMRNGNVRNVMINLRTNFLKSIMKTITG